MSLQVRKFDGKKKDKQNDGTEKEYTYVYDRIVLPWSRTGKDVAGAEVEGAIPTMPELLAFAQSNGWTTDFKIENGSPAGPSVAGFLIEGINAHLNRLSASEAMNTEEAAFEAAVQIYMKKRNCSRDEAVKKLGAAFGK